jgi:signal transduction histidine kinase
MQPTTTQPPAPGPVARWWHAPFAADTWRATAQIELGMLLALVTGSVIWVLAVAGLALAITLVLAAPVLAALFGCARTFSIWHRARIEAMTPGPPDRRRWPDPPPAPTAGGWWSRLWAQVRSPSIWRQVAYHLASLVVLPVLGLMVSLWWCAALLGITSGTFFWSLPGDVLGIPITGVGPILVITALGVVLLLTAPAVATSAAMLDASLLRRAMAPSRSEALAQRVVVLTESRSDAVAAADAERRRLERDLHDGTQQRLVSLAMNLGMTRTTMVDVPDHVRDAVTSAHEEAKLALAELRDLVRGLHPAVLDDLGLDAALSGIAARSPIPVRLLVDLPSRPSRPIEAAAYFLISEALTKAAKHSGATTVDILVEPTAAAELRIVVSDNGRGGADPGGGSGLAGLAGRISALDGTFAVHSPVGGPTVVTATLPYHSS